MKTPDPPTPPPDPDADRGTFATDAGMFSRLRSDDPHERAEAWRHFERIYTPMLYRWAHSYGHRGQDADDLVQEVKTTFVAASAGFNYDRKGSFRALLKKILANHGAVMSRKRGRTAPTDPSLIDRHESPAFDVDDAWQTEVLSEAIRQVREEYARNPRRDANTFRAFELRVLEGFTVAEVVERLHMSRASVDQAKHRVTSQIAEIVRALRKQIG
jgi:RNA polymerase sigma factor (sigma-70 family)